jgi:acyl-CoA thioesterase I
VNSLLVYHIGSGHAFFSGIAFIQLAGLSAFLRRGRWLAVCRMASVCAGVILVAVSSTPLPAWFYGIAGAVTLAWIALERLIKSTHRRLKLGLRYAMLAIWWLGIALELPFHLMHAMPLLQHPPVFLVGDSLSAGIGGEIETWPKLLSRSHHVIVHDLSRSGADAATALRQAEQVSGPTSLVLVEIGGNDVLRATRPDAFEQALDVLLAKLRDGGRTIIMLELPLPPFHNRYGDAQRRLATRHGVLLIPKRVLIGVLTSEGATLDTVHLSRRGHALMAETVWYIIGQAIGP